MIHDPGQGCGAIGAQIVVLPNGDLINVFVQDNFSDALIDLVVVRSTDKGQTWSDAIFVDQIDPFYVIDPESGDYVGGAGFNPEVAVDRVSGVIYIVWQDYKEGYSGAVPDGDPYNPINLVQEPLSSTLYVAICEDNTFFSSGKGSFDVRIIFKDDKYSKFLC